MLVFILIGAAGSCSANRNPLMLRIDGKGHQFPALSGNPYVELPQENGEWKAVYQCRYRLAHVSNGRLHPPCSDPACSCRPGSRQRELSIPFSKQFLASDTGSIELPLRYRHWLGTTRTGGDLLSALIHGTRYALLIGFLAAPLCPDWNYTGVIPPDTLVIVTSWCIRDRSS